MDISDLIQVTKSAIDSYNPDDVRQWARASFHRVNRAIYSDLSASELLSSYPYNPDSILDDLAMNTNIKHDTTKYLADIYLSSYQHIIWCANRIALMAQSKPDVVSRIAQIALAFN